MLAPALAADPREKVRRKALFTHRLAHPCVPEVYDVGDAGLPDGTVVPYLATELLTGVVLSGRLVGGPLPWPEAVATAAGAADVLAVAHRRGIVHRDLQPDNVMLTAAGVEIRRAAPTPVLVVPGLPHGTADLCRACMAKRPAGRPTAEAAAVALRGILDRPKTLTYINVSRTVTP